ncbi:MAG: VOC family protein [Pseudomonadota bacterium]
MTHPVYYFEIPVTDMDRAVKFYEELLGTKLDREVVDGYDMARFPFADGAPGATGALAKGDVYKPSKDGAIVYFHVEDIEATVAKAKAMGRPVLYPVKDIGAAGFVAEIEDSEGNRLALSQLPEEAK